MTLKRLTTNMSVMECCTVLLHVMFIFRLHCDAP